jgi:thioesterase domain-containing protein
LAAIWSDVLGVERVGAHDSFFDLGGNSLLALRLVARVRTAFSIDLPLATLFTAWTLQSLADRIAVFRAAPVAAAPTSPIQQLPPVSPPFSLPATEKLLVPFARPVSAPSTLSGAADLPLFFIHGLGGHVAAFLPLAKALAAERSVYGLQGLGLDSEQAPHDRIDAMARCYLEEIRRVQPHGPYALIGWSMGGVIALELAARLRDAGEAIEIVAMLDTYLSAHEFRQGIVDDAAVLQRLAPQLNVPVSELRGLPLEAQWKRIAELAERASGIGIEEIRRLAAACKAHLLALSRHEPRSYDGTCVLYSAEGGRAGDDARWNMLCPQLRVESVPGDHYSMLREPHVQSLAERLRDLIAGERRPSI